jgi:CRP-like cAMP-binding protein
VELFDGIAVAVANGGGMQNPLLLQLRLRDAISDEEAALLATSFSGERTYAADQDIVAQDARPSTSQMLLDGLAGRYKVLADGSRQITAVHVPGDFMDLHGFLLKKMAHGVVALTPCRLAIVEHATLKRLTETAPHLTRMLWLDTLIDGSIHREWIVAMGRRGAEARMAHFLCELYVRLRIVGRADELLFRLPLTQSEIADVLGMSVVHANRTIQRLRRDGAVKWEGDLVRIEDWDKLTELAEFDDTYLCLEKEPR